MLNIDLSGPASVTLKSIARQAGVSAVTVSNVIHRRGRVSAAVAERVTALLQEAGYRSTPRKRRSDRRGGNVVALAAVDGIFTPERLLFRTQLVNGLQNVLERRGHALRLQPPVTLDALPDLSKEVGALVLSGFVERPERFAAASAAPIVWISRADCGGSDGVQADDREIARLAVEFLAGKGHRNVGYLEDAEIESQVERGLHFRHFAQEAGLRAAIARGKGFYRAVDPQYDLNIGELRKALHRLLAGSGGKRPTALFIPSDRMCASVYSLLREMEIAPQKSLDVLSCNNDPDYLGRMAPRPPTIDIHFEAIGRQAAECALWRLAHPAEPAARILIRPSLALSRSMFIHR